MLKLIRTRLQNMATISRLAKAAEMHALRDQQTEPGAEHFLLAALDLPDGTARRVFEQVGGDAEAVSDAIERQYAEALRAIGIQGLTAGDEEELPRQPAAGLYRASASGREVMTALASGRADHRPLVGAHVVAVVAAMPNGVAARAIRAMGLDPAALQNAAMSLTGAGPR